MVTIISPKANGTCELSHQHLNKILKKISIETENPLKDLKVILDACNNLFHYTTKVAEAQHQIEKHLQTENVIQSIGEYNYPEE